jgi:hypothetical protein
MVGFITGRELEQAEWRSSSSGRRRKLARRRSESPRWVAIWLFRSRHCGPRLACRERMTPFERAFTMPGVAPAPNAGWRALEEPEPVFQLKRRRSAVVPSVVPGPAFSRTARVISARFHVARESPWWANASDPRQGLDDLTFDEPPAIPGAVRPIAIRAIGGLLIAAALSGAGAIFSQPEARREALSWVTLGHADEVLELGRRVGSAIHSSGKGAP